MTHILHNVASSALLVELLSSAARSLLLAMAAGFALRAFRVKTTALRLFAWTLVLYAALALPLLGRFAPPLSIPAPEFLQPETSRIVVNNSDEVPRAIFATKSAVVTSAKNISTRHEKKASAQSVALSAHIESQPMALPIQNSNVTPSQRPIRWDVIALVTYLAVMFSFLIRVLAGIVYSRRLLRSSHRITEPQIIARLSSQASTTGHIRAPLLAESEHISVPVTLGVLRPVILLPCDWSRWHHAKLDAVLAHEYAHVARRDALTQQLSLLHRAIFWFSPLSWWLDRHLADLAEQASDEAALSCGTDRNEYAHTLLGFFEALRVAPGRIRWQGVAMAKAGQAEQRLERILAWKGVVAVKTRKSLAVLMVAVAVPLIYVVASAHPVRGYQDVHTPPPPPTAVAPTAGVPGPGPTSAPPAPTAAPTAAGPMTAPTPVIADTISKAGHGYVAPVAPVAPYALIPPPMPVRAAPAQRGSHSSGNGSYTYGYDDEERFVIASGKSDTYTMSGSTQDIRHVEKLKKQIPGDFIWFQRDEKSYIIRDQATVERAKKFWAPQEELGRQQEALGKQQEELGRQQEELSKKMEQVRVNVPDMTAALDKLKAKLQKLGPTATMDQIGDLQSEIGDLQSKLGDIQSQAGDQQGKIGELQGQLGEKQGKLGEQQGALGEKQGELAEQAQREMKALLDEAIKNGTAKPEPESGGSGSL